MTLIFSGNDFKYELEAVCKLFFPVESFECVFLEEGAKPQNISGDFAFICRIQGVKSTLLSVFVSVSGKHKTLSEKIAVDEGEQDFKLGRLLYKCLCSLTGIVPEWGVLTGVRPIKLIHKLRTAGNSDSEIESILTEKYLVSPEKIRLGLQTANNQATVASGMPEKSFSLYVSIPFCPTRCSYCSFISQTVSSFKKLMPQYVELLCEEIKHTAKSINGKGLSLDTIYFGGGTPTSITAEDLDKIMKTIEGCFDTSHLREYTVEAGRPDTVTREKLEVIRQNGGKRVSINPQTMHNSVLEAIGRKHTVEQFLQSYDLAKEVGFEVINADLIAGLPTDTLEGFSETLDKVIALSPENVTVHALSIKRAADLMHEYDTKQENEAEEMVKLSIKKLSEQGYEPYYLYRQKNQLGNQENTGWCKKGTACIYNINIMEETQSIIAVGAGGTSKLVFPNGKLERFFNPKYPLDYIKNYETVISRKNQLAELIDNI